MLKQPMTTHPTSPRTSCSPGGPGDLHAARLRDIHHFSSSDHRARSHRPVPAPV